MSSLSAKKKRHHEDAPLCVDQIKKACLLGRGRDCHCCREEKTLIESGRLELMDRLQRSSKSNSLLTIIAETGSIDEIMHLVEFLFLTCRVETFTLDTILKFWRHFPEAAAEYLLPLFRRYGCWHQLFLLMELGKKQKFGKQLTAAALRIIREQWKRDYRALQASYQEATVASDPTMDRGEGPRISDLAAWLPREGEKWDKKLGFVRRFTKLVYPKDRQYMAKSKYGKQVNTLLEVLKSRPYNYSMTRSTQEVENLVLEGTQHQSPELEVGVTQQDVASYKTLIYVPALGTSSESRQISLPLTGSVDRYFNSCPSMRKACHEFLSKTIRHFTRNTRYRILYIHQGEVGHAIPSQCDVIVSDKATTCHVLALRSESPGNDPLTTLAHVDNARYDDCIRSIVEEHITHHNEDIDSMIQEGKKPQERCKILNLQAHIVGGFNDDRGSSSKITSWLMDTLARLAEEYKDIIKMDLATCAVSSMNDAGDASPIGRGMGIDLRTGEAFLVEVDREITGPAQQLRSARIWSGGDGRLNLVHTSTSNEFVIEAFTYTVFPTLNELLRLPDHKMIRRTSTSPDGEESDFCISVRNTLRFLREVKCTRVFGPHVDRPVAFQRVGASNAWRRIQ